MRSARSWSDWRAALLVVVDHGPSRVFLAAVRACGGIPADAVTPRGEEGTVPALGHRSGTDLEHILQRIQLFGLLRTLRHRLQGMKVQRASKRKPSAKCKTASKLLSFQHLADAQYDRILVAAGL